MPIKTKAKISYSEQREELSATLCKMSRDAATMTDLQYELHQLGFMPADGLPIGRLISGQWNQRTLQAVKSYQKEHELLYGQLTIETLEHLGIFKAHPSRIIAVSEIENSIGDSGAATVADNKVKQKVSNSLDNKEVNTAEKSRGNEAARDQLKLNKKTNEVTPKQVVKQIEFVPLQVRFANANFNAASDVPSTSKPQIYAYVNDFKLYRCRARAILPEVSDSGVLLYSDNKEFRATLCKMNRNKKLITRLQTALRDLGYLKPLPPIDVVVVDGIWGINTLTALKEYQKENGLAYGQLTIESLEHLGVFISE